MHCSALFIVIVIILHCHCYHWSLVIGHWSLCIVTFSIVIVAIGRRFSTALLPRLFWTNPRSHNKGATCRVRTGDQLLPVLCHCQHGQDIPNIVVGFVHCYCSSLFIVIVVHCSLCTKHWSLILLFIQLHCASWLLFVCIVIAYCYHCPLLVLFVVHCYCNVFCIVIVHCYHCSLLFVTLLCIPLLLFIDIGIIVHCCLYNAWIYLLLLTILCSPSKDSRVLLSLEIST